MNCKSLAAIIAVMALAASAFFFATSVSDIDSSADGNYEDQTSGAKYELYSDEDGNYAHVVGAVSGCTDIVIPSSITSDGITYDVTHIEPSAFKNKSTIKTVEIEENSKLTIAGSSFQRCTNLESVVIGLGVESIESNTFYNCSKLTKVVLPETLKTIGISAFQGCKALSEVNLSDCTSLESIAANAFSSTGLKSVNLPDSLRIIGNMAFASSSSLMNVVLGENLESIGTAVFTGCSFTAITIPSKLTDLHDGDMTFSAIWPSTIRSITIADGNPNYHSESSGAVYNSAGSIIFFDRMKTGDFSTSSNIEAGAFQYCKLDSIKVLDGATSIGKNAFSYSEIKTLVIADSVTSIGTYICSSCKALTSVSLPDNINELEGTFSSCSSLHEVKLPEKLVTLGTGTFSGCKSLTGIELPEGLETIGVMCFMNSGLESISFPSTLKSIEREAFRDTAITEVSAGDYQQQVKLGNLVFWGDSYQNVSLNNVAADEKDYGFLVMGSNVTVSTGSEFTLWDQVGPLAISSDGSVLYSCLQSATGKVTIPASVTQLGAVSSNAVFSLCNKITEIGFEDPDSVVKLMSNVLFRGDARSQLSVAELPNVEVKGKGTLFIVCPNLESVSWTSISELSGTALSGCPAIASLDLSGTKVTGTLAGLTGLRNVITDEKTSFTNKSGGVFSGCSSLESISLYDARIAKSMFKGCTSLAAVHLYNTKSIMDSAFEGCTSLSEITIPDTLMSIGSSSFKGCTSLAISFPAALVQVGGTPFGSMGLYDADGTTALVANVENLKESAFCSDGTKLIKTYTVKCVVGESAFLCAAPINGNFKVPALSFADVSIEGWYTDEGFSTLYSPAELASDTVLYAKTSPSVYKVVFNSGEGTSIPEQACACGSDVTSPETDPSRSGYAFGGWYYDRALTEQCTFPFTMPAGDVELFAKWSPVTYEISFDANGGAGTMENLELTYDVPGTLPSNAFALDGKLFVGWNTKADGSGDTFANSSAVINLAHDQGSIVALYAQWASGTTCVIFDANGGVLSGSLTAVASSGSSFSFTQSAERTGYSFDGWYDGSDGGQEINSGDVWNSDSAEIRIYAHWQANKYTVVFHSNDEASETAVQTFEYGEPQYLNDCPFERAGKFLLFWNTDADGKGTSFGNLEEVINLTAEPNGTVNLYASAWATGKYLLNFSFQGGSGISNPIYYAYGEDVKVPTATRKGYTFAGWFTDYGYTDKFELPGTMPAKDLMLFAKWAPIQYSVEYDPNGGTGEMSPQTFTYDDFQSLSASDFVRPGYVFAGWSGGGFTFTDGQIIGNLTISNEFKLTLYAVWTPVKYTISFESPESTSGTTDSVSFTLEDEGLGSACISANGFLRTGYTFAGWASDIGAYQDKCLLSSIDIGSIPVNGDSATLVMTASWTVNSYTIAFDTAGGSAVQSITADYGSEISSPVTERTGYTFAGWLKDGAAYELPSTMPAEDLSLTASWTVNSYTIAFDTAGGSAVQSITADYGSEISSPVTERAGYVFVCWLRDGEAYEFPASMPAENLSLTAYWEVFVPAPSSGVISMSAQSDGNLTLTEKSISTLKDYAADGKTVLSASLGDFEVEFDSLALRNMSSGTLTVRAAEDLDEKTALLTENATVYEIVFGSNSEFGGGTLTVTVPYVLKDGQNPNSVKAYCIVDGEVSEVIDADISDGKATFQTNHLSLYAIGVIDAGDESNDDIIILAAAVAVILAAAVIGVVYSMRRRY